MGYNILDNIDQAELGKQLQEARKKRGMTQEDAAKLLQVARTTIVAIEKGERRIKASELVKLADAYGRRVSDFVRERPEAQLFQVQFRAPLALKPEDSAAVEPSISAFEEACRDYVELESITQSPLKRKYRAEYSVTGLDTELDAEDLAQRERNRLSLGDGPVPKLRDLLEQDIGMRVFYLAMPSKYSEMYWFSDQWGGCLAANKLHSSERRNWSLAHGYCHFLVNRYVPVVSAGAPSDRSPRAERLADSFAKYFLMPSSGIRRRFSELYQAAGKVTLADLVSLSTYYSVSFEALVRRLEEMRLLPSGVLERLKDSGFRVRAAKEELGLADAHLYEDEMPRRYRWLAIQAYEQGRISEGQFARFLRKERLEARQLLEVARREQEGITGAANMNLAERLDEPRG
jgi:Zn-dependent peptidase ImmA (M78 family)/transcriptional regulator with XRE-family HTH domain